MKSKPTTLLLAIIAALLAVNLFVNLPPQEAKAQLHRPVAALPFNPPPEPTVVGVAATHWKTANTGQNAHYLYRVWSDGLVERNHRGHTGGWQGWVTVPE